MVASSDFGLSLHWSISNMDLPIKVLDFLGANVPVIILNYNEVIKEVVNKSNGYLFKNEKELKENLVKIVSKSYKSKF